MFKIKIPDLEIILDKKIKRNIDVLGIDIATECGYCIAKTDEKEVTLDYNYIKFPKEDNFLTYQEMATVFRSIIKKNYNVVIEDSFYSRNYKTFKLLSRFGGIVVGICEVIDVKGYTFKTPSHLRAQVGLKMGKAKKGEAKKYVRKWILENLDLDIDNDNVADGIIIALYGLIDHTQVKTKRTNKLRQDKIKKKRTKKLREDKVLPVRRKANIIPKSVLRKAVLSSLKPNSKYVQVQCSKTKKFVKVDKEHGKVVSQKKSVGPYKNIPICHRKGSKWRIK